MAGIGGWLTTLLGSENKSKAAGRNVNSDNYQYGGSPGEAERQAEADRNAGIAAQRRQGVTVNYGQADQDRARALQDRSAAQQARQGQNQVAQTSLARALGQAGPSIAQQQADRQMQQAQAAQASMAGSARGAGALANAQRNAANNVANAGAQISGQAQIAAAQERRDDTALAGQQYGNMRGGDLAQQGQSLGMQAQSANQAQSQAGFNDAQRARNDQYQQGQNQLAQQTRLAQLAANQNYEAQQSSNALGAQGINAGVGGQNASMNQANGMSLLGGAQSLGGAAFSSFGGTPGQTPPAKAKGGPVEGRAPYLVGERGPELIIPANDGMVIPSGPTQEAIQRTPSLARFLSARACGGPVDGMARAEGGPVESGGEVPPNPTDAGYLPAGYAPPVSTWGGSPVDADVYRSEAISDQRARMAPYEQASANVAEQRKGLDATAARINETVSGIDERDRDAVWNADYKDRHNQQMTAAESEQATEARYRQDSDRKQAKAKKKPSLSSLLADGGKSAQMAGAGVDTAYHGPGGGFAPPMLIPLQARAFGGPIMGGGAPSMLQPLSGPGSGAAPASFDVLTSSGGMDPMSSLKAHSNFATQFQRNPGASPMGYSAREEGGPVKAGGVPKYDPQNIYGDRSFRGVKTSTGADPDAEARASLVRSGVVPGEFAGMRGSTSALTDREIAARDSEAAAYDDGGDRSVVPVPMSGLASLLNLGRAQAERYAGAGVSSPQSAQGHGRVVPRDNYNEERQAAEAEGGPDSIRRYPGAPADEEIGLGRLASLLRRPR